MKLFVKSFFIVLFSVSNLLAEENEVETPSLEENKPILPILIFIQTKEHRNAPYPITFTLDLDNKITATSKNPKKIRINNCWLTNLEGSENHFESIKTVGTENKDILNVFDTYKQFKVNHPSKSVKAIIETWLKQTKIPFKETYLSCLKNEKNYSPENLNLGTEIFLIPKYIYPFYAESYNGKQLKEHYSLIDELNYDNLFKISNLIDKGNKTIAKANDKRYETYKKATNKQLIGGLIISNNVMNKSNKTICTSRFSGDDAERIIAYRLKIDEVVERMEFTKGSNFGNIYNDVNDAYLNIKKYPKLCRLYIDYAENIFKLKKGLDSSSYKTFFTDALESEVLLEDYAKHLGFLSAKEKKFLETIGWDSSFGNQLTELLRLFREEGISDEAQYNKLIKEIKTSGYATYKNYLKSTILRTIPNYFKTKREAKKNNVSIAQYKKDKEAKAYKQNLKDQKKKEESRKKFEMENPYIATISCGLKGGNISLMACFENSTLEITNGTYYRLYNKAYDILNSGLQDKSTGSGYILPLKKNFKIAAKNSSDSLTLNVKIKETSTGKLIFQKSAPKNGFIFFSR